MTFESLTLAAADPRLIWAMIPSPLPEEPPIDPNLISPGLLGLAAFVLLIVAAALLFRSMRNQLRKVSPGLPEEPPREPEIPIVDEQPSGDATDESTDAKATSPDQAQGGEPPARG